MNTADYMTDAQGRLVPADKVKPEERLEDETVLRLFHRAQDLNAQLGAFKKLAFDDIDAFLELLSEKYGAQKGGRKGNVTLTSFDGLTRVQISVAEFIDFGPSLKTAKELIDTCINSWSDGANANLKIMVDHAFRVDRNNRINTKAILGLRRYDIRDEQWQSAMQAIGDAIRVTGSRAYIRFYQRAAADGEWRAVSLDLASI